MINQPVQIGHDDRNKSKRVREVILVDTGQLPPIYLGYIYRVFHIDIINLKLLPSENWSLISNLIFNFQIDCWFPNWFLISKLSFNFQIDFEISTNTKCFFQTWILWTFQGQLSNWCSISYEVRHRRLSQSYQGFDFG